MCHAWEPATVTILRGAQPASAASGPDPGHARAERSKQRAARPGGLPALSLFRRFGEARSPVVRLPVPAGAAVVQGTIAGGAAARRASRPRAGPERAHRPPQQQDFVLAHPGHQEPFTPVTRNQGPSAAAAAFRASPIATAESGDPPASGQASTPWAAEPARADRPPPRCGPCTSPRPAGGQSPARPGQGPALTCVLSPRCDSPATTTRSRPAASLVRRAARCSRSWSVPSTASSGKAISRGSAHPPFTAPLFPAGGGRRRLRRRAGRRPGARHPFPAPAPRRGATRCSSRTPR